METSFAENGHFQRVVGHWGILLFSYITNGFRSNNSCIAQGSSITVQHYQMGIFTINPELPVGQTISN